MKIEVSQRKDAGTLAVWLANILVVAKCAALREFFGLVAPDRPPRDQGRLQDLIRGPSHAITRTADSIVARRDLAS